MANHNQNGGRNGAISDENRASWRPQDPGASGARSHSNEDDHDYRSWRERDYRAEDRRAADRDPRRWEGGRGSELGSSDRPMGRSTERYGQGQSGYAAGRYGDDRSQHMQNRNEMVPSPGSFEDRHHDLGVDDRFTGRGVVGYWQDRSGYDPEGYAAGRGGSEWRGGASEWRGYDQGYGARMERNDACSAHEPGRTGGGYDQRMGYQGSSGQGSQSLGYQSGSYGRYGSQYAMRDDGQRHGTEPHIHRGTGPHRGKGPQGYQRSDERIRELVCEALTDDDQIDASQIQVTVKDGDVTLTGVVDDRRTRREAEECVASVCGVRDVQVQLRVKDDRHGQGRAGQAATGQAPSHSAGRDGEPGQNGFGKAEAETSYQDRKHRA